MGVVGPGGQLNVAVQVSRVGGFDGPVYLSLGAAPDGFSAEDAVALTRTGVLHIEVGRRVQPGTYKLTIVGRGMDLQHSVQIQLVVH
jgi:hypothetical protein